MTKRKTLEGSMRKSVARDGKVKDPRPRSKGTTPRELGGTNKGWFKPGNPYAIKPGETRNPEGLRDRSLSKSYRARMNEVDPDDPHGRTYSELIAARMHEIAMFSGNEATAVMAAREIRSATEGTTINSGWEQEVVKLLKSGELTPQQVTLELGPEKAMTLLAAAGLREESVTTGLLQDEAEDLTDAG